ncbi:MAG: general secretion pathway protein GspK [Synergistaceae bacterium]|nr:general secretion pathway protein GspK [Synergistaceae bacterium]
MRSRALSSSRKHRRKGFVLISVLMLGTLLISCATAFSWFVRQQVKTVSSERLNLASRSMANVLVNAMINVLAEMSSHVGYDSPTQRWYQPFVLPLDDLGVWIVEITPLDDKIPIRNLFLPDGNTLRGELTDIWHTMWENLGHLELEHVVLDFLDKNNRPRVGGVERDEFLNRPPYDMSELLMLSTDISPEILAEIEDYCTVYSDGRINLNVAPVHVMEILPGLDVGGIAARIEQTRKDTPLQTLNDVQNLPGAGPKTATQLTNIVAFKSRYFRVKIDCISDNEGGHSYIIVFDRTTKQIVRWEEH